MLYRAQVPDDRPKSPGLGVGEPREAPKKNQKKAGYEALFELLSSSDALLWLLYLVLLLGREFTRPEAPRLPARHEPRGVGLHHRDRVPAGEGALQRHLHRDPGASVPAAQPEPVQDPGGAEVLRQHHPGPRGGGHALAGK